MVLLLYFFYHPFFLGLFLWIAYARQSFKFDGRNYLRVYLLRSFFVVIYAKMLQNLLFSCIFPKKAVPLHRILFAHGYAYTCSMLYIRARRMAR